jgi:peptidoglycan/LPS O-acetylase OafA/YrhL
MRNPYVDYLRGISLLIVLMGHGIILPEDVHKIPAVANIQARGYYGVTLFFVISGYLITSRTLMRYGSLAAVPSREFYAMRTGRIVPCLLLSIAALVGLNATGMQGFTNDDVWTRTIAALTLRFNLYRVNFTNQTAILPWEVLWSLSIEEVFYLAFPLVCHLYQKPRYICIMLLIVVINGPWYRHNYQVLEGNFGCVMMYLGCFDSIALGCLVAMLAARCPLPRGGVSAGVALGGVAVTVASLILFPLSTHFVIGPTCVGLGAAIYLFAVHGRTTAPAAPRPLKGALALLASCGFLSYEIYLFHGYVTTFILDLAGRTVLGPPWAILAAVGCMAIFGVVTYFLALTINRYYSEPLGRAIRRKLNARTEPAQAN